MSEPKFSEGQPVLMYGAATLPIVTQVTRIMGCFAASEIIFDSRGGRYRAGNPGWYYETEDHSTHEDWLRPIIDPDSETETEDEVDDITA